MHAKALCCLTYLHYQFSFSIFDWGLQPESSSAECLYTPAHLEYGKGTAPFTVRKYTMQILHAFANYNMQPIRIFWDRNVKCILWFHAFSRYRMNTFSMSGTVQGNGDTVVSKKDLVSDFMLWLSICLPFFLGILFPFLFFCPWLLWD